MSVTILAHSAAIENMDSCIAVMAVDGSSREASTMRPDESLTSADFLADSRVRP
jgi:hypothetical protein